MKRIICILLTVAISTLVFADDTACARAIINSDRWNSDVDFNQVAQGLRNACSTARPELREAGFGNVEIALYTAEMQGGNWTRKRMGEHLDLAIAHFNSCRNMLGPAWGYCEQQMIWCANTKAYWGLE